jgi:hypothetical protein
MNNNKKILCRVLCLHVSKTAKRINPAVPTIAKIIVIAINTFSAVLLFGANLPRFLNQSSAAKDRSKRTVQTAHMAMNMGLSSWAPMSEMKAMRWPERMEG